MTPEHVERETARIIDGLKRYEGENNLVGAALQQLSVLHAEARSARIEKEAKKLKNKWQKSVVKVATSEGDTTVTGWTTSNAPGLAIHKSISDYSSDYVISHEETGCSLMSGISTLAKAAVMADALAPFGFDCSKDELLERPDLEQIRKTLGELSLLRGVSIARVKEWVDEQVEVTT